MKLYIDFDGIIVDSWPIIVNEYKKKYFNNNIEERKLRVLFKEIDWDNVLQKCEKNHENLKVLEEFKDYDITILTKINSLSEKISKEKFLLKNNIKIKIETVDIERKKSEIVNAKNNILIDDEIKNLKEWEESGGIGILYSKNKDGRDSDGLLNEGYPIIYSLQYEYIAGLLTR